ncbi:MAG: PilT/PilU family type 4a pilus ATPase [Myxococcota bacterium]
MAQKKPLPLAGRLAIQLKMLTRDEVEQAIAHSESSGNPKLAQVFLEMGLLDREQVAKLREVQKDLVEKHRAKRARVTQAAPSKPETPTARVAPEAEIHSAAAHAAEVAAPMTAADVDALRQAPSAAPTQDALSAAAPEPSSARPEMQVPIAATADEASKGFSLELSIPEPSGGHREKLEAILSAGVVAGASDVHLHAGAPLKHRVHGQLQVVDESIEAEAVERMVSAALTAEQRRQLSHDGEIDFCLDLDGIGRFRANAYRQQRGLDVVFRVISERPPTLDELGLPEDLKKYTDYHQGMVLLTGPAGCGKSSTLAALVNHINENREEHLLTVEDPIEIIHPSKGCLVNQRHAGHHTSSFSRALRGALREDPDIIVIGELRDTETISLAMTAAETGHFVLASLHTANAVRTVNRMIGAFPSNEQDQVRAMLSESLRAVISQRLVPTADGQGRVPALEVLVISRAIGNMVRDEKTVQIRSSMQTGRSHGMYLLEQSLNELVASGKITREVALDLAEEKKLITAGA